MNKRMKNTVRDLKSMVFAAPLDPSYRMNHAIIEEGEKQRDGRVKEQPTQTYILKRKKLEKIVITSF
jgi:hypothetical protein